MSDAYFDPAELRQAGVKATDATSRTIVADFDTWQDWYQLQRNNAEHRQAVTRKIKDPKWQGPDGARLAIDVLDAEGGELAVTFHVNGWNAYAGVKPGSYYATKPLATSVAWQTVEIHLEDLIPLDEDSPPAVRSWQHMTELGLVAKVRTRRDGKPVELAGMGWPEHRQLRNLRWLGGRDTASSGTPHQQPRSAP